MIPTFRYPGGKATIRKWLIDYFPTEGEHYFELFTGRGNMYFLARSELMFQHWHLNDITTAPFLVSLREWSGRLPERVTKEQFECYRYDAKTSHPEALTLEPALTVLGKGYEHGYRQDHNLYSYARNVAAARDLIQGARIYQHDWSAIRIPRGSFVYLDPPYYDENSYYSGGVDHEELLDWLLQANFDWLISGYPNDLYDEYLGPPDATIEKQADMANFAGNSGTRVEALWRNYD